MPPTIPASLQPTSTMPQGAITVQQRKDIKQFGSLQAAAQSRYESSVEKYNTELAQQKADIATRLDAARKDYNYWKDASRSNSSKRRKRQAEIAEARAQIEQYEILQKNLEQGKLSDYSGTMNQVRQYALDVKRYTKATSSINRDRPKAQIDYSFKEFADGSFQSGGYLFDKGGYQIDPSTGERIGGEKQVVQDLKPGQPVYVDIDEISKPGASVYTDPYKQTQLTPTQKIQVVEQRQGRREMFPMYEDIDTLDIKPGPQPLRFSQEVKEQLAREQIMNPLSLGPTQDKQFIQEQTYPVGGTQTYRRPTPEEVAAITQYEEFDTLGGTTSKIIGGYKKAVVEPLAYEGKVFGVPVTPGFTEDGNFYWGAPLAGTLREENIGKSLKYYEQEFVIPLAEKGVPVGSPDSAARFIYGQLTGGRTRTAPLIGEGGAPARDFVGNVVGPAYELTKAGVKKYEEVVVENVAKGGALDETPVVGDFLGVLRKPIEDITEAKVYINRLAKESPGSTIPIGFATGREDIPVEEYAQLGLFDFGKEVASSAVGKGWERFSKDYSKEVIRNEVSDTTAKTIGGIAKIGAEFGPYAIPGYYYTEVVARGTEPLITKGTLGGPSSVGEFVSENQLEVAVAATLITYKGIKKIQANVAPTEADKIEKFKKYLTRELEKVNAKPADVMVEKTIKVPGYKKIYGAEYNAKTGKLTNIVGVKGKGYTTIKIQTPTGEKFGRLSEGYMKQGYFYGTRSANTAEGFINIQKDGTIIKQTIFKNGYRKVVTVKGNKQTVELFSKNGKELVKYTQPLDDATAAALKKVSKPKVTKSKIDKTLTNDNIMVQKVKVTINGKSQTRIKVTDLASKKEVFYLPSDKGAQNLLKKYNQKIPSGNTKQIFGEVTTKTTKYSSADKALIEKKLQAEGFTDVISTGQRKASASKKIVYGKDGKKSVEVGIKMRATPKVVYGTENSKNISKAVYGSKGYTSSRIIDPNVSRLQTNFSGSESLISYVNPRSSKFKALRKAALAKEKALAATNKKMLKGIKLTEEKFKLDVKVEALTKKGLEKQAAAKLKRDKIKNFFFNKSNTNKPPQKVFSSSGTGGSQSQYAFGQPLGPQATVPNPQIFNRFYSAQTKKLSQQLTKPLVVEAPVKISLTKFVDAPLLGIQQVATQPAILKDSLKIGTYVPSLFKIGADSLIKKDMLVEQDLLVEQDMLVEQDLLVEQDFLVEQEMFIGEKTLIKEKFDNKEKSINRNYNPILRTPSLTTPTTGGPPTTPNIPSRGTPSTPRPGEPFKPPKIIGFPDFDFDGKKKKKVKEPQAYHAYVKPQGSKKFVKITEDPHTKEGAMDKVARIVDNTLSAQGKWLPAKKKKGVKVLEGDGYYNKTKDKFRGFNIVKGKKVPTKNKLIEKRNRRFDTPGETARVTVAQAMARSKKRAAGLPTRRGKNRFRL